MSFASFLSGFIDDLKKEGVPLSPDELVQCYRALLLVDWEAEEVFYSALYSTLIKDCSYLEIFDRVYARHFHGVIPSCQELARMAEDWRERDISGAGLPGTSGEGEGEGFPGKGSGTGNVKGKPEKGSGRKKASTRALFEKNFISLTSEEIKALEALLPLIGRRMVSRMIKKRRKEEQGSLDFRCTFRRSLSTGGVPVELFTLRKVREKPVIFALCDVSSSVWEFSYFSLALVHSLERFFQRVRSFAFVDEIDEITDLLRRVKPHSLRGVVLRNARVMKEGRTDYGFCLKDFYSRFAGELTPQTYLLIFGDARNNWFSSEEDFLKKIAEKVKRLYWFNPEERKMWDTGDSIISTYRKYCHGTFSCPNIKELESALGRL